MFPVVSLFGFSVASYGLLIACGAVLANLCCLFCITRSRLDLNDFLVCEGWGLLGALLGAKVLYLWVMRSLIDWPVFFSDKHYFLSLMNGGFVFYGGLIGGMFFALLGARIHKIDFYRYVNRLIFALPLAQACGRLGCFAAGCCYGLPNDGLLAVTYQAGSFAPQDRSLFALQPCESAVLLLLSWGLYKSASSRTLGSVNFLLYLCCYGSLRFVAEFFRADDEQRGIWLGLSTSQWLSLTIVLIFLPRLWWLLRHRSAAGEHV